MAPSTTPPILLDPLARAMFHAQAHAGRLLSPALSPTLRGCEQALQAYWERQAACWLAWEQKQEEATHEH